ncbi:bifunctional folylpolyglutamate synthase/dihydrofolate synthase [Candidatus Micrarchaeota archaeon]|nr:bifunctional folylpolyglutamate synthase/dihydrofolate synthase [Candidatus Micrarchaeota archaeon]
MLTVLPLVEALPMKTEWSLSTPRMLADRAGVQLDSEYVHVVGSNGKGSTSAFLERMVREEGYRTALYTSPHLHAYNERFQVNGRAISDAALSRLVDEMVPLMARMKREKRALSPFEVLTVMALRYFEDQRADMAIMEAGLGGRLDATNICPGKTVVVPSMGLEHCDMLGNNLASIAREKAGVIKPGATVVSGVRPLAPYRVIATVCRKQNARLLTRDRDFRFRVRSLSERGTRFDYQGIRTSLNELHTSMIGAHQALNASCALAAVESMESRSFSFSSESMRRGVHRARWPGRLERITNRVWVDAAHNLDGVRALADALRQALLRKSQKMVLVFGCLSGKSADDMLSVLLPFSRYVVLVHPESPRAHSSKSLVPLLRRSKKPFHIAASIPEALTHAVHVSQVADRVLVTGSLYLVGPARQRLIKRRAIRRFYARRFS